MGKTEKGAIWLNKELLSPYDYWQFWRNTDDRDVKSFLNFFTELNSNEINILIEKEKNINNLKILLANEATKILHGKNASVKAQETAKKTFEGKGIGSDLPEIKVELKKINEGLKLLDLLSSNKITSSKGEARRAIINKGLKINNSLVTDENKVLNLDDFQDKLLKISFGKKSIT